MWTNLRGCWITRWRNVSMGQEANCEVRFGSKVSTGTALLETGDLIFRGDFRLSIPLKSIQSLEAADGVLRVTSPAENSTMCSTPIEVISSRGVPCAITFP